MTTSQQQFLYHLVKLIQNKELYISDIIKTREVNPTTMYYKTLLKMADNKKIPSNFYESFGRVNQKNLNKIIERYKEKFCKK